MKKQWNFKIINIAGNKNHNNTYNVIRYLTIRHAGVVRQTYETYVYETGCQHSLQKSKNIYLENVLNRLEKSQ